MYRFLIYISLLKSLFSSTKFLLSPSSVVALLVVIRGTALQKCGELVELNLARTVLVDLLN